MIVRGCLMGALGVVVGLAAVADVSDIGARHLATHKVEQRIRQVVPHTAGVHGRIRSFPFLAAAVDGRVSEVSATIDQLAPYTHVSVDLHHARISIGTMVTALRIDVTRISSGEVSFDLTDADLQKAAPSAAPGSRVAVDGLHRKLVVTPPSGHAVLVDLPPVSLVPCVPALQPVTAGYTLGCSFRTAPLAFRSP